MTMLYFAYGANLDKANMSLRCPDAVPYSSFFLDDWKLKFCQHATVVPESGSRVPGALWRITERCERSLDRFEGYPYYYHKQYIGHDEDRIMFYVMNSSHSDDPSESYLNTITQGYDDWGLPYQYLHRAVQEVEDQKYTGEFVDWYDDRWTVDEPSWK